MTLATNPIEQKLRGSLRLRFWQELLRNSGQFPIAIILIELLNQGAAYLTRPDIYGLIPAVALQSYVLARWADGSRTQRLLGNLIAPLLYTLVEFPFEGLEFFAAPQHTGYWIFSLLIGILQASNIHKTPITRNLLLILEDILRSQILFFSYFVFETRTNPIQTTSLSVFLSDSSHIFIGLTTLLLGFSVGLANITAQSYLHLLKQTINQLKIYSEWLLGRDLLQRAIGDPHSLSLSLQKRTILFMDIRGFTAWSEHHTPEQIANLLNFYYGIVEQILNRQRTLRFKFTADETMAVFLNPDDALQAANQLQTQLAIKLGEYQLGAGIGVHTGNVMEGLLGSPNVKFYDVIGDPVNTAKRIESYAKAGQIWLSQDTLEELSSPKIPVGEPQIVSVKGKDEPLKIYPLSAT
ncbi:MAG: adenylate/guanylate cyclase domain-containing protein [Anaerolineales bacterium]